MTPACQLCDGGCTDADLAPLLDSRLTWLWEQIGRVADRRGDPMLTEGTLTLQAPAGAEERAAVTGLVGARVLGAGQTRRIDLAQLTEKLRVRGARLTPGVVAAHALGRQLASRAIARAQRRQEEDTILLTFLDAMRTVPQERLASPEAIWNALKRTGWVARLAGDGADATRLIRVAAEVISRLPSEGARLDRRLLAADTTGDPHALDHGTMLAGLTLAVLVAAGRVPARQRPREAWAIVGVDCDDVVGGLFAVGISPVDWVLPGGACTTVPPRVLASCTWPRADTGHPWVFVTENPSIAAAAADLAQRETHIRLLCMIGRPSGVEIAAMARLVQRGWHLAVRADFDAAGLQHVDAVLKAVPSARPWRMRTPDYLQSLQGPGTDGNALDTIPDTPWDAELAATMRERGIAAFEEALLRELAEDLRLGRPG